MSAQLLELKKNLKAEIAASLNREGELSDAALYQTIDEKLLSRDDLSLKNKLYLRNAVFNSFRRLDVPTRTRKSSSRQADGCSAGTSSLSQVTSSRKLSI